MPRLLCAALLAVACGFPAAPSVVLAQGLPSLGDTEREELRMTAGAVYTVGAGHASWVRRAVDAVTYGPVREQVRLARLAGDREALAEWTERLVKLKDSRAERLRRVRRVEELECRLPVTRLVRRPPFLQHRPVMPPTSRRRLQLG